MSTWLKWLLLVIAYSITICWLHFAQASIVDYGPPQDALGHWEFDLYDASGNQRGTNTTPLFVSQSGVFSTGRTWNLSSGSDSVGSVESGSWIVTANAGTNLNTSALAVDTSVNGLLVAQGSSSSSQKGPLTQGAVTSAAPSYTTGQTSPLSLTTTGSLRTDSSAVTQPVSAASLPLPAGAATSANQTTMETTLTSIDAGIPAALGQTTMSASMPVTLASDQTAIKIAKTALGNNSATVVSVGVANTSILGTNANRTGAVFVNLSSARVSFAIAGATAVLNNGITLLPGGTWVMDEFTFTNGAINAIAGTAASSLAVQEFQ